MPPQVSSDGSWGTISVVIPTYDRSALLERAVRSCLAQTCPVHEVLVCDDGSTDGSEEMIHAMGDPRVKWLPGTHAGRPAIPRNRGIAAAKGVWVAFLDSDDAWLPQKLATQLERLSLAGLEASCTNAERIGPTGGSNGTYFQDGPSAFGLFDLLKVNRVICSSALVKRTLMSEVIGFPEAPELKALEDYALWLRIAALTDFDYCPAPLVRYTDTPSISLRSGSVDVNAQRDAVLTDLLQWDNQQIFSRQKRRNIVRHLRRARRHAGRSFTDWMFLR